MTPLEEEMLAALKLLQMRLDNFCDGPLGKSPYLDDVQIVRERVADIIAKAEPKPRRWVVEQHASSIDIEAGFLGDGTLVSYKGMRVIREVKPITREQIQAALRKRNENMFIHDCRLALLLRELGIDVEN